jgi:hypothetical protein
VALGLSAIRITCAHGKQRDAAYALAFRAQGSKDFQKRGGGGESALRRNK